MSPRFLPLNAVTTYTGHHRQTLYDLPENMRPLATPATPTGGAA